MILARLTIVLTLLVLATTPALAQGRRVTEGTLLWKTAGQEAAQPAPLLDTDVEIRVTGMVVRAIVRAAVHEPQRGVGRGRLRVPAARGRRRRSPPDDGRRPGARGRRPRAGRGRAAYAQARQEGRRASAGRAGAAQHLHHLGRQHPAGRGGRIEIEYQQAVRYDDRPVRAAFSDGGGAALHPGCSVAAAAPPGPTRTVTRTAAVESLATPTRSPTPARITPPVRASGQRHDQPGHVARRPRRRRAAGRGGVLLPRDPHDAR